MNEQSARRLMEEWTPSMALRVHMEAVAACMARYAERLAPAERERWLVTGLLHDFDYERHPSADEHPLVGVAHLRTLGVDEEICGAILAHAPRTGAKRDTPMAVALFAVDELAGFIVACAKVRPNGMQDMAASSVKKKLKDRSFAAAVSREDIALGAAELGLLTGLDDSSHITECIHAIAGERERLGV